MSVIAQETNNVALFAAGLEATCASSRRIKDNSAAKDGLWKIGGKREVIYANRDLSIADQLRTVRLLSSQE